MKKISTNSYVNNMETIQELPLKDVEKYVYLSSDVLSAKRILDRTNEIVIRFSPEYIIEKVDELLKLTSWLSYEKKTLEMLKKLLRPSKTKKKSFTRIRIINFIKFSHYAFEASIERATWVKDRMVTSLLKKAYDKYTSTILFVLSQNIMVLKKIKDIEPKNEIEMVEEVKRIIRVGPKIQNNILDTYALIIKNTKEGEMVEKLYDETLDCIKEYSSLEDL